ncbi:MAG: GIY-YIG nuclease family protein [Sodalinema sp.]|uniref:GIY-YIG nuclease family protein n=1 Tax=Sodalinema sp. TaxID=3080550 RepID=UPI0011F84D09|nr:MAG: GIY-YIG nuclease family protein [Phormidium sp. SL48-SHIP]
MSTAAELPSLQSLKPYPYLTDEGNVADEFLLGKVGIYAIFDQDETLQFVGYSRNVSVSLRQHLIRQPEHCYSFKVETIDRPSRTLLEDIRQQWLAENGTVPPGNGEAEAQWTQPIDVKPLMTDAERSAFEEALDEGKKTKCIKQVARRVQATVLERLAARGVMESFRFNPKLKEQGLLELK